MGYLLKEVLKTFCGVNQWSYAVFWKIGCQNPKLLIWEECYYETIPCSSLPRIPGIESLELAFEEWEACWFAAEPGTSQVGVQAEDKLGPLMNKMMMGNRVNIVGEGLVGRAAFTGDHLWTLSQCYNTETYPPEVRSELCQQFSSGMKTVAVIPVLTHGVVQLGSSLAIRENMAFVNDVKSLIFQLGCVPGALLSDNYTPKEPAPKFVVPVYLGKSASVDYEIYKTKESNPFAADSCNQQSISSQAFEFVGQPSHSLIRQTENSLQDTSSKLQIPKLSHNVFISQNHLCEPNTSSVIKSSLPFSTQLENGEIGADVIPSNLELWLNQQASLFNPRSGVDEQHCSGNSSNFRLMQEQILSDVLQEHFKESLSTSGGFVTSEVRPHGGSSSSSQLHDGSLSHPRSILTPCSLPNAQRSANHDFSCTYQTGSGLNDSKMEVLTSDLTYHLTSNPEKPKTLSESIAGFCPDNQNHDIRNQSPRSRNAKYKDECVQPSSGEDLFDILGVDFKNKIFNDSCSDSLNDGPDTNTKRMDKKNCTLNFQNADSGLYSVNLGPGTDHLLDAVVNRVQTSAKQCLDDSMSCKTTLKNISDSSVPNASPSYGRVRLSDKVQGESFELPKSLAKLGAAGSCSFKSEYSKEDAGNYSQTCSIYGSQMSSWVEQGYSSSVKNSSASTTYSKKPDEVSKSSRKRLKPGENTRPRPKDRQMIQDRMKELKEIIPNGGKCSIDALLERTIKHMLFLQSVTKHADKLKQTGESKMVNKDGGQLLKENFEGGRTWAYEVGSQSLVCPIIVEDLNPPRQMLVEMLCEERGLFLEIADIIRGLGLTILQGVMETRNDKIWARFAVEANRDVTRMEIFISLVHLLEKTAKSSAASGNAIENETMMVHQSLHQAASIPATGRPCS